MSSTSSTPRPTVRGSADGDLADVAVPDPDPEPDLEEPKGNAVETLRCPRQRDGGAVERRVDRRPATGPGRVTAASCGRRPRPALEPAATALATDGMPAAAAPAAEHAADGRLAHRAGGDGVGGDRRRRRQGEAELVGEVITSVEDGGHQEPAARPLAPVGEHDGGELVAAVAANGADLTIVHVDAGAFEPATVVVGEP